MSECKSCYEMKLTINGMKKRLKSLESAQESMHSDIKHIIMVVEGGLYKVNNIWEKLEKERGKV